MSVTIDSLGFLAALLTTLAFLPQVVKTWASGSARELSLPTLLSLSTGVMLWLVYGLMLEDRPLIIANGVTFCLVSLLLALKLRDVLTRRT